MSTSTLSKYGYRIRTRSGVTVDNLTLQARDEGEAQQKLMRMYPGCTIIDAHDVRRTCNTNASSSFVEVVDILTTDD